MKTNNASILVVKKLPFLCKLGQFAWEKIGQSLSK